MLRLDITRPTVAVLIAAIWPHLALGDALVIDVPGSANPWLAGMPDGTAADDGDVAPDQSPVLVEGLLLLPRSWLIFSATGQTSNSPTDVLADPDGNGRMGTHRAGAEHGISDIAAPGMSLIGVFLGADRPDVTAAPAPLGFTTTAAMDYSVLAPQLKQTFFIGDGRTSTGGVQRVRIPRGASRVYLGTRDGHGWSNNVGTYSVTALLSPEADINYDGFVGADDLTTLILNWNATDADLGHGDITGDGFVGADDLSRLIDNWNVGTLPVGVTAVPEPMSLVWLGLLLVVVRALRSR